ncbi:response regulator [Methylobacterium radiotolerans]|uniref:response regulator n=1 Tax=Methylobacterium radiotolerans TaxID=31998 RepID=UPI0038D0008D
MRAFVIDDSRVNRILLSSLIEKIEGATVIGFENPRDALEKLFSDPPDIVLVDQMMERMSGVDFIREARARPSIDAIPIVMVTSNERKEIKEAALEAGATDFIAKPFDTSEITARVRNLMTLRRASDPRSGMRDLADLLAETFAQHERHSNQPSMRTPSDRRVAAYAAIMLADLGVPDLARRIFQVASTFDALVTGTTGRPAVTIGAARDQLLADAGGRLDKAVVEAFLRNWEVVEQHYDASATQRDI